MLIPTIIICIQGICFNPAMVTYLNEGKQECRTIILRPDGTLRNADLNFKNTTCEALAAQINQKIKEQLK